MAWRTPYHALPETPPEKSHYKELIKTKISAYHEKSLRLSAKNNSKMTLLNVSLVGLRGRHHPALSGIVTTSEVRDARFNLENYSLHLLPSSAQVPA